MEQLEDDVLNRPLAHFPADIWGDMFLDFSTQDNLRLEKYGEEIEPLQEEVRNTLMDDSISWSKKMSLIDAVERLGVSYFYEQEIKMLLDKMFQQLERNNFKGDCDLHETATQFRIFRQHGYKVPCNVFTKFTNGEGKLKETLRSDMNAMVSLYEAAQLRMHYEAILEEALVFATSVLRSTAMKSNEQARRALQHPLHHTMQRVESHHFISVYEEDESRDETLLLLAKLDFNRLQLLHRKELNQIQKWWRSLDLATKLPYARNRSVESHFTANGMYFEPQYSNGGILLAKVVLAITILNDTYDAYGTLEELQHLTDAFERWDLNAMDQLPDTMKIVYSFVINLYEEFEQEMTKRGKPYASQFAKEAAMELIGAYMKKAKRREAKHTPSYEEYMIEGRITGTAPMLFITSLMGMDDITNAKPFHLIRQSPKAIRACELFCRLINDIYTHEQEQNRSEHASSSLECYMKEYGTSKEVTVEIFEKKLEDLWKDINEELVRISRTNPDDNDDDNKELPKPVFDVAINFLRMLEALYEGSDGFTNPAKVIKDHITALYVLPFSII